MPRTLWEFGSWERISDQEAKLLYDLWKASPAGGKLAVAGGQNETLTNLKIKGYLSGLGDCLKLTQRGQRLIREMAIWEPNSFEKKAEMPPYSKIKDKKASRPRQTHVAKQSKQAALVEEKVFNLRRASFLRMVK